MVFSETTPSMMFGEERFLHRLSESKTFGGCLFNLLADAFFDLDAFQSLLPIVFTFQPQRKAIDGAP